METLNDKIQTLRDQIDRAFKDDAVTREFRDKCNAQTASLFVAAVSKGKHPIHSHLEALGDEIADLGFEDTYWVAPHFNSGNPQRRKFKHLQFLMRITLLAEDDWQKLMSKADADSTPSHDDLDALHTKRKQLTSLAVDDLSPEAWLGHLRDALDLLYDPGAVLHLDGNTLIFPNGQSIQLKQSRLTLMRMLLEAPDNRVRHEDLHAQNVNNPTRVLSELRMRLVNEKLPDINVDNANGVMHLRM